MNDRQTECHDINVPQCRVSRDLFILCSSKLLLRGLFGCRSGRYWLGRTIVDYLQCAVRVGGFVKMGHRQRRRDNKLTRRGDNIPGDVLWRLICMSDGGVWMRRCAQ